MIDTTKPISLYDDRSKNKEIIAVSGILYQNEDVCLCRCDDEYVLFSMIDGEVLTNGFQFWYATNELPEE